MSKNTAIEWAQDTWNPVTGCDRVSPGCDYCYAQTLAKRLKAMGNPRYQVDGDPRTSGPGFGVTLHHDKLDEPLRWRKPTVVFVNSMSDLFHDDVPDDFIAQAFAVMGLARQHTFQVLTKRPRRMARLLADPRFQHGIYSAACSWVGGLGDTPELNLALLENIAHPETDSMREDPLPNVWLGTSVEDQKRADLRIPHLLRTPAAVRFLSCEPLLGPVDLRRWGCPVTRWDGPYTFRCNLGGNGTVCSIHGEFVPQPPDGLHWIIVGGESGPGARPMHPEWARSLRDQCQAADVPFFFKQWGGHTPKAGGRELDGRTWDEMPDGRAEILAAAPGDQNPNPS